LGDRKGTRLVKKLDVHLLMVTIWSFARLIAPVVTTHHLHYPWLQ